MYVYLQSFAQKNRHDYRNTQVNTRILLSAKHDAGFAKWSGRFVSFVRNLSFSGWIKPQPSLNSQHQILISVESRLPFQKSGIVLEYLRIMSTIIPDSEYRSGAQKIFPSFFWYSLSFEFSTKRFPELLEYLMTQTCHYNCNLLFCC